MMSYSSYSSSLTLLPKKPITLHCLITSTWKHLSDLGIDHANGTTLLKTSKCNINSSILNKARRCLESAMLQNSTLYWPATGSFPSFSPLFRIFVSAFPTIHISQKENNPGMRRSSSAKSTGWFPRHNYVLYNIHRGVFLFLFSLPDTFHQANVWPKAGIWQDVLWDYYDFPFSVTSAIQKGPDILSFAMNPYFNMVRIYPWGGIDISPSWGKAAL